MLSSAPATIAVLASGSGSNFESLVLAARNGELGGEIAVLLCDHPSAPVLERARRLGIDALCPPAGRFRTRLEDERPWLEAMYARAVGTVLLAGFMRRLHGTLLMAFPDRILNLHPSLLPAFPGLEAIRRAWEHGVRVTGCTVHLVTADVDGGPILAQSAVDVREGESLASLEARIHEAEHELYPATVRRYLSQPWRREGRRFVFGTAENAHA